MAMRRNCCTKLPRWQRFTDSKWSNLRSKRFLSRRWEARSMRNIWLVARREYLEQVRGRAFKMTTFGLPIIFAVVFFIGYLSNRGIGSGRHLAVASNDPALASEIKSQLVGDKDAKAKVDVISPASGADHDTLVNEVRAKQIDG